MAVSVSSGVAGSSVPFSDVVSTSQVVRNFVVTVVVSAAVGAVVAVIATVVLVVGR